ncbi:helix-turn-helix domain-containing protein [Streptomyces sp. NPDC014006]|uniref:helix-turn-helix domain-containing protein n=1 Tax=Streptomyces sp. NPDC014006 TaxID=3364870 RepID=UPI003700AC20
MSAVSPRRVERVAALALDGVHPFELGMPSCIFGPTGPYEVRTCTADGRPVRTNADFAVAVDHGPEILDTAYARMSLRTFARRFDDEVGVSPGRRLIQQRAARARHLLESSDLPVDQIAGEVCSAGASPRRHLHTAIAVTPQACRRTFRAAR